jgi:hypothetical protein
MTGITLPTDDEDGAGLADADVARAMMTILDPAVGTPPGDVVTAHRQLLERIVELMPARQSAPAHTLLALLAWWSGTALEATEHLTAALDADPNYRLAHLIAFTFSRAIQPGWLARP